MFEAWHDLVRPDDEVWHLGDLMLPSWKDSYYCQQRVKALPGVKHLLRGNHDHRLKPPLLAELGFQMHRENVWLDQMGMTVVLSHFPVTDPRPFNLNVHGHTHNNPYPSTLRNTKRSYRNISVEMTDYKPVRLGEALAGRAGSTPAAQGFWPDREDPERVRVKR